MQAASTRRRVSSISSSPAMTRAASEAVAAFERVGRGTNRRRASARRGARRRDVRYPGLVVGGAHLATIAWPTGRERTLNRILRKGGLLRAGQRAALWTTSSRSSSTAAVATITLNRPAVLNALNADLLSALGTSARRVRPATPSCGPSSSPVRASARSPPAPTSPNSPRSTELSARANRRPATGQRVTQLIEALPRAGDRCGQRLRPRRRLRARDGVRLPDRQRKRKVRAARSEPRHPAGLRRHAAHAAAGRRRAWRCICA